jgi:hypothetical protein
VRRGPYDDPYNRGYYGPPPGYPPVPLHFMLQGFVPQGPPIGHHPNSAVQGGNGNRPLIHPDDPRLLHLGGPNNIPHHTIPLLAGQPGGNLQPTAINVPKPVANNINMPQPGQPFRPDDPRENVVLFRIPPEILEVITKYFWNQCTEIRDLLNWFSTNKDFWEIYLNYDDEKMLEFAKEKKKLNQQLLSINFHSQYNKNKINFSLYESIIQFSGAIKKCIASTFSEEKGLNSFNGNISLVGWNKWEGIQNLDELQLTPHSYIVLNAVFMRIRHRFNWDLYFTARNKKEIKYPFKEGEIQTRFFGYLCETSNTSPAKKDTNKKEKK